VGVPQRGTGEVFVYEGATGFRAHVLEVPALYEPSVGFGTHVSYVGDVDADGFDDILASGPYFDVETWGVTAVHSGATGQLLHYFEGICCYHIDPRHVGGGVTPAGDLDEDGHADFGMTMSIDSLGVTNWIYFISGSTGAVLCQIETSTERNDVGFFLLNADRPEARTIVQSDDGEGAEGQYLLHSWCSTAPTDALPGPALARPVGDWDGDGLEDVALGRPSDSSAGTDAGAIEIWSDACAAPPENYCSSEANSSGAPAVMGTSGSTSFSANDFSVFASDCPPNQTGIFYMGTNQADITFGNGVRCVGTPIIRYPLTQTGSSGVSTLAVDNQAPPAQGRILQGSTWNWQFWFRDPMGGGVRFDTSDGLRVSFCR
jgi:hypothetical protein